MNTIRCKFILAVSAAEIALTPDAQLRLQGLQDKLHDLQQQDRAEAAALEPGKRIHCTVHFKFFRLCCSGNQISAVWIKDRSSSFTNKKLHWLELNDAIVRHLKQFYMQAAALFHTAWSL